MERILRYEKNYLKIYLYTLCIMLLYMFVYFNINKDDSFLVCLIIMASFFAINILLYVFKFFLKNLVFFLFKFTHLFVLSLFFYKDSLFVFGLASLFYILICIQLILCFPEESRSIKTIKYLTTFGPMIISPILFINKDFVTIINIFFIIQYLTAVLGIYKMLDINSIELSDEVKKQTELFEASQNANKALTISQNKLQAVNEQMVAQKFELEHTNKELNRISGEMYIQNELLTYISSTLEIEALMDLVTDAITGAMGVDTCSLIIQDDEARQVYYKSKSSHSLDVVQQLQEARESGILRKYFKDINPHMNSNVDMNEYPFIKNRQIGSIIIVPLIRNNVIYGLMISEQAAKGFFVENNLQFFQSIATQINIAVNNASLYTKLEEIASKDGLTGIYNRSNLQQNISRVFDEVCEAGDVISVALLDIDKFKKVNDTYGHLFGDEAIKMVARFANTYAIMHGGFAGRYGGEEFVVVLPNIGLKEATMVMEKMHSDLKKEPLYHSKEELVYINISIGVTEYPAFAKSAEDLLDRADNAMYYSKNHGRGKITIDSEELSDSSE